MTSISDVDDDDDDDDDDDIDGASTDDALSSPTTSIERELDVIVLSVAVEGLSAWIIPEVVVVLLGLLAEVVLIVVAIIDD